MLAFCHSYSDESLIMSLHSQYPSHLWHSATNFLDIRLQQRNGRKTLTTVQGLPKDIDQKRVLKAFKKDFACNGTIIEHEEMGEVIQLQGDHRVKVTNMLVEEGVAKREDIKIHGF